MTASAGRHDPGRAGAARTFLLTAPLALLVSLVLGVPLLLLAACGGPVRPTASAPGTLGAVSTLVVLAGPPGARHLLASSGAAFVAGPQLPAPAAEATWLSVDRAGRIVLTLSERRGVVIATVEGPGSPRLATSGQVSLAEDRNRRPVDPVWFGTWSPSGTRLALLGLRPEMLGALTVLIADPVTGRVRALDGGQAEAGQPAWLDDGRLAVLARGAMDEVGTSLVDLATGNVDPPRGAAFAALATSGDGSTLAVASRGVPEVHVGPVAGWSPDTLPPGSIQGTAGGTPLALALDASGERLAVVWQDADGGTTVTVHRRADGWRTSWTARVADAVAAAWLPT